MLTNVQKLAKVGVEHLLRDINDPSVSTLAEQVGLLTCGNQRGIL